MWFTGFSLQWLLFLEAMGSSGKGFSSRSTACGLKSSGSVVATRGLSCCAACGISPTRDQTHAPCLGWWILTHSATPGKSDA